MSHTTTEPAEDEPELPLDDRARVDDIGAGAPGVTAAPTSPAAAGPSTSGVAPAVDRRDRVFPVSAPRLALQTLAVAASAWLFTWLQYGWWRADINTPYGASVGDGKLIYSMVKTITERGWYTSQPRLGAPFGQTFYDFPHGGESLQLLAMRVLTTFVRNPAAAINIYFFFGFGLVAAVTFLVLRHLRFSAVVAALASLSFTLLTYHQQRGEWHLWRSSYYSVPLAVLVILWSQQWRSRFLVDPDRAGVLPFRHNLRWRRVIAALVLCVIIGGTESMATAFAVVLLVSAALIGAIRWREPGRLVVAGVLTMAIAGTFALGSYQTFDYWRVHGSNKEAANRTVAESELYGLKPWSLVMPPPDHRVAALGHLSGPAVRVDPIPSEIGQNLGLLATAGFLGALYGGLTGGLGGRRRRVDRRAPHDREVLRESASIVVLSSLLFGVSGGFAVLVALVGPDQVRVWNRMVIFIALASLLVVGAWAERLDAWLRGWRRPRVVRPAVALLVLAVVLGDTINIHPNYRAINREWANDQRFVDAIERRMPAGSAIFQLPVLAFPEVVAPGRMTDYDPFRGYMHDHGTLRWSYGAIQGRTTADWQVYLRDHVGPVGALPALLGLGFTGLWVDTYGYTDGGAEVRQIEQAIGTGPLRSDDGRLLFYDLRPYRQRLGKSDTILRAEVPHVLHLDLPAAP
ncbi:MAG: hypothetical protein JWN46_1468 [Acidimicrobiales bacterium]|nr:hypothetical protein [Acidimicrobiales bacterium]